MDEEHISYDSRRHRRRQIAAHEPPRGNHVAEAGENLRITDGGGGGGGARDSAAPPVVSLRTRISPTTTAAAAAASAAAAVFVFVPSRLSRLSLLLLLPPK